MSVVCWFVERVGAKFAHRRCHPSTLWPIKHASSTTKSFPHPHSPLPSPVCSTVSLSPYTTMDQSYPTTADDIFASWLDLLEMQGYLYALSMGSLSEPGYLPAPGNLLEPGNLPNYNTINDMAFPQAPMTSMGAFTSSLTQQYNTYQVSKLRFERRH